MNTKLSKRQNKITIKNSKKVYNNFSHKGSTLIRKLQLPDKKKNSQNLIRTILKFLWIQKLERKDKKIIKKEELLLSYSKTKLLKLQRISKLFVQDKMRKS